MPLHRLDGPAPICRQRGDRLSRIPERVRHQTVNAIMVTEVIDTTDVRQRPDCGCHIALGAKFNRISYPVSHPSTKTVERVIRHDATAIDDDGTLTERLDFREDVSREDHCPVFGQPLNERANAHELLRIEATRGLVQNQDLWVVNDGLRESNALAIALREGTEEAGLPTSQTDLLHDGADSPHALGTLNPSDVGDKSQVFSDAEVFVERRLLREVPDA